MQISATIGRMNMGSWMGSGTGGGVAPPAEEELLYFGQRAVVTPGDGGQTGFAHTVPTLAHDLDIDFVNLLANGFLHIRMPTVFEISEIRQVVLGTLGENIIGDWVKTEDYTVINTVSYDSYTRGPINPEDAGQDISYRLTLVAGA